MSDTLLIEKVYERFSAGDLEGWAQLHAPDFEFKYLGNLPFSGIFNGPQNAIDECFLNIPKYLENFLVTPIRMFECGDTIFVHIHMTATNLDTEAMHMFTVQNGLVKKFQGFDNTGLMAEAFINS
ncbi:MAG: nuclear transport factor 2 family protein [Gammaproteobacteria bacterium]|jgi:ketosteroid isomerase-like protein|nr:nuclear transport factor 2 family protein [Gammaproteobacteria bacterium]MDG1951245.1 nuclear transport factor 2 family protein [Gammaproteobacteria bacterium]MDG2118214.1 nuclear transport factor 2 family protein [Gammaproteobacteria bacterium]